MVISKFKVTPKNILLLNLGLLLSASGVHFFKNPNHFAIGGTSGLAILLNALFPQLDVGVFMLIVNGALVGLGFIFLGREFGFWTIYASFALSAFVWLLGVLVPINQSITGDMMLDMLWAVVLPSTGSALVFNLGASTGGTDIVAMILSKHTSIEIGKALFLSDIAITIAAGFFFGPRIGLYCVLALMLKSFVLDSIIDGINMRKKVTVVSCRQEEIKEFIIKNIHRGVTVYKAYGGYTGAEEEVLTTVLNRRQMLILRNYIRSIDPKAFMTVVNSSETIGKGFREI